MAAFINLVQSSAKDYGGHCTFRFSQCTSPVDNLINMHEQTSGGICKALSTKWIVEYSKDDSIWNWLYKGGVLIRLL